MNEELSFYSFEIQQETVKYQLNISYYGILVLALNFLAELIEVIKNISSGNKTGSQNPLKIQIISTKVVIC